MIEVFEENMASHKYMVVKRKSMVLVVFTDNCAYFSLILTPSLTSAYFLKVSWNVEIKISMNFFVLLH